MHDSSRLSFPLIVCSLLERDVPAFRRRLDAVPRGVGMLEIRADHLRPGEIAGLVRSAGRPAIVTVRRPADGGAFDGSEAERRNSLLAALAAGARYVDVESDGSLRDLADGDHRERVILSLHGCPCRRDDLRARYAEIATSRAALLKLVPRIESVAEIPEIREFLLDAADPRLTCFPVGEAGRLARVLALSWGAWGTYGSPAPGRESAPGQLAVDALLDPYEVGSITAATRLFLLVGAAVSGSPSPAMHRAAHRAAGIDARYLPLEVADWAAVPQLVRRLGVAGLAVTLPFKEHAAAACTLEDPVARGSRAVNTVLVGAGGWAGYNTDGPAAVRLLRRHVGIKGAQAAIRGAGGTARALATALREAGARVMLFNRTAARGRRVADELGLVYRPWAEWGSGKWDLLVNATPVSDPPRDGWSGGRRGAVLDAAYGPRPTPLVRSAREHGIVAVDGFELLVEQGVLQFERMNGTRPEHEVMRRAGAEWMESRWLEER